MERNLYWDTVKGVLIVLVVWGHVLRLADPTLWPVFSRNMIYSFHMPLFVLTSGYFAHLSSKNYIQGILKMVETFLVFQLLLVFISDRYDGFMSLFEPSIAMWYLLSLSYWKVFLFFLPASLRSKRFLLFLLSVMICLLGGFVKIGTFLSIQRTMYFLPFFVFGFLLQDTDFLNQLKTRKHIKLVAFFSFLLIGSFFFMKNKSYLYFLAGSYYYDNLLGDILFRIFFILVSFSFCLSFLLMIKPCSLMANIGRYSLHIYIYHIFLYLFLKKCVMSYGFPISFFLSIVYSFLIIVIVFHLHRIKLFMFFLNPFSNLYKR